MNEVIARQETMPTTAQPGTDSAALISVIERAALNPNVDIEKMERLFALQQQFVARQAETAFNGAMALAQSEMDGVVRMKVNTHTRSMYADLDSIHAAIKPIYTRHGFSLSFGTGKSDIQNHIGMTCTVRHRDGHSEKIVADFPLDIAGSQGKANKTAIQAVGSTQTYARRYMETMVFNIAMRNDTDGNAQPANQEPISAEQLESLMALVAEVGANAQAFAKFLKVERLDELPASGYDNAVKWLEAKRKKGAAQ